MYQVRGKVDDGDMAPAFRARDVLGREFSADDFRGRASLVLFFYRDSRCQTCREELKDLAEHYGLISGQDGEVFAISTDSIDEAKDLAVDLHLPFPVFSDPDGRIIRQYGACDDSTKMASPTVFLVDRNGVVRFRKVIKGLDDRESAGDIVNRLKDFGVLHGKEPFKSGRYK